MQNPLLASKDYSIDSLIECFHSMCQYQDRDELRNEGKVIKSFIKKYMLLPLIEWCSLYFYWEAGNLFLGQEKLLPIPYVTMLVLFAFVICLKFHLLRSLQESDVEYMRIAVDLTLEGQVGGCMPWMIKKITGKHAPIAIVIRSMPAYLSGSTSFVAMPGTLDTVARHPEVNRSWNASWDGHMPLSLAQCFVYLLISMTIIHIIGFYYYTWKAFLLACKLEFDKLGPSEAFEVRSTIWHHIAEAASQGNLLVISQIGDAIVQGIHSAHGRFITAESRAVVGVANVSLRIFAYAEVLAWLKISLLAEGFDYLGTIGCIELEIAIGMGLLTVALTIPDQFEALRGGSTRDVEKKGVMLMMTSILLIMLCFRLIAVFFICEKHIYNFSEMGCFDESATWLLLASNAMLFFVGCMTIIAILYLKRSAIREARAASWNREDDVIVSAGPEEAQRAGTRKKLDEKRKQRKEFEAMQNMSEEDKKEYEAVKKRIRELEMNLIRHELAIQRKQRKEFEAMQNMSLEDKVAYEQVKKHIGELEEQLWEAQMLDELDERKWQRRRFEAMQNMSEEDKKEYEAVKKRILVLEDELIEQELDEKMKQRKEFEAMQNMSEEDKVAYEQVKKRIAELEELLHRLSAMISSHGTLYWTEQGLAKYGALFKSIGHGTIRVGKRLTTKESQFMAINDRPPADLLERGEVSMEVASMQSDATVNNSSMP